MIYKRTLHRRTPYDHVSVRATIVLFMPVAYGRLAVRTTSAAVRGCFPNILWREMNVPKMQQAPRGEVFRPVAFTKRMYNAPYTRTSGPTTYHAWP